MNYLSVTRFTVFPVTSLADFPRAVNKRKNPDTGNRIEAVTGVNMFKKLAELTLVEVVMMMAIVATIGAMTAPQFVVAADEAGAKARWNISVTAKDTRSTMARQSGTLPTVVALADQLSVAGGKAISGGIQVQVDGDSYTIPTYTNDLCNKPTRNVNDQVGCVGNIQ